MSNMHEYRGKLTESERSAVDLRFRDGVSVRSLASVLELPYGQVRGYVEWLQETEAQEIADDEAGALKVLFFDIETAPLLAHVWRAAVEFIPAIMMVHDSFMLTWSAKWMGNDEMMSASLTGDEARRQTDERIVVELADLIRKADVIVAHNVDNFDLPMFNSRLLLLNLEPLGPTQTIDTLKLARKNFRLSHNKLDYLAEQLGLGRKIKTDFDLWLDAYHGDEAAIKEMLTYNQHDVVLLEQVFEAMRPYVSRLTRLFDPQGFKSYTCGNCGKSQWNSRGYYRTQASTFRKLQCQNCGRYSRSRVSEKEQRSAVYPL